MSSSAAATTTDVTERDAMLTLCAWIEGRTGIVYRNEKTELLINRLRFLATELHLPGLPELADAVADGDNEDVHRKVAEAALVQHTAFFREPEVLRSMVDDVVAGFAASGPVRVWSAAASSGEESYTVAMLLAERLGLTGLSSRVALLGSDIGATGLRLAEAGVYAEGRIEAVPDAYRQSYLEPAGMNLFRVHQELRDCCMFRRLNLMQARWPFRRQFHVVLCRNVFYYFDREKQEDLLERLRQQTKPGGLLVTSVTEPVRSMNDGWEPVSRGIYRRVR